MEIEIKHLINGNWHSGSDRITAKSPHDLRDYASFPVGDGQLVQTAVESARSAFSAWSNLSFAERGKHLGSLCDALTRAYGEEGEATTIKKTIINEVGKPLPEADLEVIESADFMRYFVEFGSALPAEEPLELNQQLWPTKRSIIYRRPYGVVAIIKPWNYPLEMIAWSLAPALMAGNTVVIKPSEKSAATAYQLAKCVEEASLPAGVVNVVFGDKATGATLVANREVAMVTFTGSFAAGRSIAQECASQMKKCSLELSGNDAAIVSDEIDVDLVGSGLVFGAVCNAGQVCVGTKRAYIHEKVYDVVKSKVLSVVESLAAGRDYGPIIDEAQLRSVEELLKDAVERGAKVLTGGQTTGIGCYFMPTVLEVDDPTTRLLHEECFGPLLPLVKVATVEEAIQLANDSEYGLGASVWIQDNKKGIQIAKSIEVGMVWINDVNVAFPQAPWGGVKKSGYSFELGDEAIRHYSYPMHINWDDSDESKRYWWYPYE